MRARKIGDFQRSHVERTAAIADLALSLVRVRQQREGCRRGDNPRKRREKMAANQAAQPKQPYPFSGFVLILATLIIFDSGALASKGCVGSSAHARYFQVLRKHHAQQRRFAFSGYSVRRERGDSALQGLNKRPHNRAGAGLS
jgi:hypothetical protein